jgi:alpha-tubulin suppressor-like RCC1 family protein
MRLGVRGGFLWVCLALSCSVTQDLSELSNRACAAGEKGCADRCVRLDSPATGCAAASCSPCESANGVATCTGEGRCAIASCAGGFKACGGGCVPVTDPATGCGAGACDPCLLAHAAATCDGAGRCAIASCEGQFRDCDDLPENGCESDLGSDKNNCAACGRKCSFSRATSVCVGGHCSITACDPGYRDCDESVPDGCEVRIATDAKNCGVCGKACPEGRSCEAGSCVSVVLVAGSASGKHTCAVASNGAAYCWGDDTFGQIGRGIGCDAPPCAVTTATAVSGLAVAKSIAVGGSHTCAINGAGALFCWGANALGQLGLGHTSADPERSPRPVSAGNDVGSVSLGKLHTCALEKDGTVDCWGDDGSGQLGRGMGPESPATPAKVQRNGAPLAGIVSVAAGARHTCAVHMGGIVYCWGAGDQGQLGVGSAATDACPATGDPSCLLVPTPMSGISDAVTVSAGVDVTCVLRAGGGVACTGNGEGGKLGTGSIASSNVPVGVAASVGATGLKGIAVGADHACGVQPGTGSLYCWGKNQKGELFSDPAIAENQTFLVPTPFGSVGAVAAVASGDRLSCVLSPTGNVSCAGDATAGQIGDGGAPDGVSHPTPKRVVGLP